MLLGHSKLFIQSKTWIILFVIVIAFSGSQIVFAQESTDPNVSPSISEGQTPENSYTEEQKRWALAVNAIQARLQGFKFDKLGGGQRNEGMIAVDKMYLEDGWDVKNREEALAIIKWLKEEGHRAEYNKIASVVINLSDDLYPLVLKKYENNPKVAAKIRFVKEYYKEIGDKSIIAWDLCRVVNVAGMSYIAGYISENEAWNEVMAAAKILQQNFHSWEEMAQNFVLGSLFWGGTDVYKVRVLVKNWLLTNQESPWLSLKWDLPLK